MLRAAVGVSPTCKLAHPLAHEAGYRRDLREAEEQADQWAGLECSRHHAEVEAG
jgi:hypothetical protein